VGAPVGPTGCTATADDPRVWTVGLSYGFSDTRLVFPGSALGRVRARQWASAASLIHTFDNGTVLGGSIGGLLGGTLESAEQAWTIEPGVVWSLTVGRRWFGQRPAIPFLLLLGTFSGSSTRTRELTDAGPSTPLHALDARLDLAVGWTIGEAFSPYLAVRGFGGPVLWRVADERVFGGDLYHVSLALGFNLSLANRVGLYFDGAFLGMRSLGGGVSVRF
jgi:hypothetical protein